MMWSWIHAFEHELSLPALMIRKDVKKLSWACFEPLRFGVPNSSRTFDLNSKSLPALIIIMI